MISAAVIMAASNTEDPTLNSPNQGRGRSIWVRANGLFPNFVEDFNEIEEVAYVAGQQEIGENGIEHFQGMIIFEKRLYASQVAALLKKQLGQLNFAWGSLTSQKDVQRMRIYIEKDDTTDPEYSFSENEAMPSIYGANKQQEVKGKTVDSALRLMDSAEDMDHAMQTYIESGGSTACWLEAKARRNMLKLAAVRIEQKAKAKKVQLMTWQIHLKEILEGTPSQRSIYVVLDTEGNCGKTFFMKWYKTLNTETTVNLSNGKTGDLSYIVSQKPECRVIFYNLVRTVHGIINYQAMESFKDGEFCSTKYQGSENTMECPHLVVFTNEPLNWEACSMDRWEIIEIGKDGQFNQQNYQLYMSNGGKTGVSSMNK